MDVSLTRTIMKKYLKLLTAASIATATFLLCAPSAMARDQVDWSLSIGTQNPYPPPVIYGPPPVVYQAPQRVYVEPPPPVVVYRPQYYRYSEGDWRERQWRERQWREREWGERREHRGHHDHHDRD
jgi:hypothetical protein